MEATNATGLGVSLHIPYAQKAQDPETQPNKRQIQLRVDEFAAKYSLHGIREVLREGALLAHYPQDDPDDDIDLDPTEGYTWGWRKLYNYMVNGPTMGAHYLGAIVYGQVEFSLKRYNSHDCLPCHSRTSLFLINWAPYIGSIGIGWWNAEISNRLLGRRKTIILAAIVSLAAHIPTACSPTWPFLFLARVLGGACMGIMACSPLYLAEVSIAHTRGFMISQWQMIAFMGDSLVLPMIHPTVLQIATTCTLILWTSLSVESPHWLVLRGQMYQAYVTLRRLRRSRILAARDLYRIYLHVGDHDDYDARNLSRRLLEILTVPSIRRMLLSAAAVMISLDLCGTYMVKTLLKQSLNRIGLGSEIFFEVVIVCVSMYATTLIDKCGRRRLLLKAMSRMVLALWFSASVKILPANTLRQVVEMALHAFFLIYWALGQLVPVVYLSELFPISRRETGISLTVCISHMSRVILRSIVPNDQPLATCSFAVLSVFAFSLLFLTARETKRRELEEMEVEFGVPTTNVACYRLRVQIPYLFRRNILRQDVALQPFEESRYNWSTINLADPDVNIVVVVETDAPGQPSPLQLSSTAQEFMKSSSLPEGAKTTVLNGYREKLYACRNQH